MIMDKKVLIEKRISPFVSPLFMTGEERLAVWEQAKAMLRHKAPAMLKELRKIRKEWDRKLPSLK